MGCVRVAENRVFSKPYSLWVFTGCKYGFLWEKYGFLWVFMGFYGLVVAKTTKKSSKSMYEAPKPVKSVSELFNSVTKAFWKPIGKG